MTDPTPQTITEIPRMTPDQIAMCRALTKSRWLVRLTTWGDFILGRDRQPFGLDTDVIAVQLPDIGPSLAASCVGLPVNMARRADDGNLTHFWPDGAGRVHSARGFHAFMLAGVVEDCWSDQYGLVGTILVWGPGMPGLHEQLAALDAAGLVRMAGLCLVSHVSDAWITQTPLGATVAVIRQARGISLDVVSHSLRPGSRMLRRLAMDEDARQHVSAPDVCLVPREWLAAATPGFRSAGVDGDVEPGNSGVGTGNVAPLAITTPKRQAQGSQSFSYSLPANGKASPTTITHGIAAIPNATFDSGNSNGDFAVWLTNLTTTQLTMCGLNISASPISGVATVYFW